MLSANSNGVPEAFNSGKGNKMPDPTLEQRYKRLQTEYDYAFGHMLTETDDPSAGAFFTKALQDAYNQGVEDTINRIAQRNEVLLNAVALNKAETNA